jgi:integrase/recombinase XerD
MRWITTCNRYLNKSRFFFRWFHNHHIRGVDGSRGKPGRETHDIVKTYNRKSKRVISCSESEIWDLEELETLIKYKPFKHRRAAIALMWDLNGRNHEINLLRIKLIRLKERYGEGEISH